MNASLVFAGIGIACALLAMWLILRAWDVRLRSHLSGVLGLFMNGAAVVSSEVLPPGTTRTVTSLVLVLCAVSFLIQAFRLHRQDQTAPKIN